jgi:hypothetical protein
MVERSISVYRLFTGGSIDGTIRAADQNLAQLTDTTVIIPGHGPVSNRSEMMKYRDRLATMRDKVAASPYGLPTG